MSLMPPRTRAPKADTSAVSDAPTGDVDKVARVSKPKPVAVIVGDFTVAKKEDLAIAKHRPRDTNPYDDVIAESYKADHEKTNEFVVFTTRADAADDQVRLIRGAAQFHDIGSVVRVGASFTGEDGESYVEIAFRGKARSTRKPKVSDSAATESE
jgi:hypothetical protein